MRRDAVNAIFRHKYKIISDMKPDYRMINTIAGSDPGDDDGIPAGAEIEFRQNWYRPDLLGRLRERTFVAAPITYSAYRFVRSLYGTKGYDRQ